MATLTKEILDKLASGEYVIINGGMQLKELQARNKREAQVLARGWEPWQFNKARPMHFGLLERTSLRRRFYVGLSLDLLVLVGVAVSFWLAVVPLAYGSAPYAAALACGILGSILAFLGLGALLDSASSWHGYCREEDRVYNAFSGEWDNRRCLSYHGFMPKTAYQKWQRDKGLFDRVYVVSNDLSLFNEHSSAWERWRADPFLVGRLGQDFYLGAQWDLAKELGLSQDESPWNGSLASGASWRLPGGT